MLECIRAIAPERRAAALVAGVLANRRLHGLTGIGLLERFPSVELYKALVKCVGKDRAAKAELDKVRNKHAKVLAAALEIRKDKAGAERQPPILRCSRVTKPRAAAELSPLQQKQLVECGRRYDRKSLSAAARLGPGDYDSTGSFRGFVELWELAGAEGQAGYDAWRCMVDSGTVFRAGTTQVVAEIIQFGAESKDELLAEALDAVLSKRVANKRAAAKQAVSKRPARAAAPKAPAKKPAVRKPARGKKASKKPR